MPESKGIWQPIWSRGGKPMEIVWIGKDVIAWCSGFNILSLNITQNHESLRWCPKSENNDGICCLSGHPTLSLLAFSEKTFVNPKIRIHSYPSMSKVSDCIGGSKYGYFSTVFNSTDNLISLTSYPTYTLTIWSWRTGEKLSSIVTSIHDMNDQIIRVTCSKPTMIAQLGRLSGKLHIWEMIQPGKTIILTNHKVILPKEALAYDMDWSSESGLPLLAIVDNLGHIYISNENGSNVNRIVTTQHCGICLEYEAPALRWFRDGIILKTTFCQIRFFKKDIKNSWHKEWYVKSSVKPCNLSVHPTRSDRLFYHSREGFLMELELMEGQKNPLIEIRMHHGGFYTFADIVRPWGHHTIAINDQSKLTVLDCYDGKQVAQLDLEMEGEVMQLLTHPDIPMAVITTKEGELIMLSLRDAENPFVIAKFNLQNERLDLIRFSQSGNNLVVGQRTTGICYCISLTRNKPFTVVTRVETKCRMADVLFYDDAGHFKLLVLIVSSRRVPVGRHLVIYDLEAGKKGHIEATSYLELPYVYQFLHYAPEGLRYLIATVYLSRQIHLLKIEDWKQVNLVEAMTSGHQVRRPRLCTDRRWITSAAFDGLITLRSGKTRRVVAAMTSHHRKDLGVVKTMVQPSGNVVVALGHDGSLVAMKFCDSNDATSQEASTNYCRVDFDDYEKKKKEILADYTNLDPAVIAMLSKRVEGFPPVKHGVNQTWFEWNNDAILLEEAEQFSQQKIAIQDDFVTLQHKVIKLLNDNETCPEIERLPISAFDLDKIARDQKLKAAKDEREDVQHELDYNCIMMEKVANWIKITFWDSQKVVGQSIYPIFGNDEVTNYSMESETPNVEDMLRLGRLYWDSKGNEVTDESLDPSKWQCTSNLQVALPKPGKFDSAGERQRMEALLGADDEEDHEIDPDEIEDQLAKEGMTTHRFIEPLNHYCSQFEGYAFHQLLLDNKNIKDDCKRLQEYFNKLFVEMFEIKEREMNVVRERYERIRYIDSELKLMFGESVTRLPIDPDWNCKEMPKSVVSVLDHEVKVKPYVSVSQQELLNRRAMDAEKLRIFLLADDFKDKALMKMMDGVLEIRWEDVIKNDIEKPRCMLMKDPDQYNADDLLAVRQYEKDVDCLELERLRYRKLLEAELTKINESVQEIIDRFNKKLRDLFQIKMRIESAIQQLNLRNLRGWIRHVYRMKAMKEDDETRGKIVEKVKIQTKINEEIRLLENLLQDSRSQYEILITREKTVEKKFRSDFPSLRKIFVEILEKEFKRRPRMILKNVTIGDLDELARNVGIRNKNSFFNHECSEYLRYLEILDVRPFGLSQIVENHHWEHLIRLRRNKIELEIKIKAKMAEIRDIESTINEHNSKINKSNDDIDFMNEKLDKMKQEIINFDLDIEIQLILKMGQVEIRSNGKLDDMTNAIFIPRDEIDNVNEMIRKFGGSKLIAMNRTINFRRGIIFKEWEHKFRKMRIMDLDEDFCTIVNVTVTRDVREYLKRRSKGHKDEKTAQQLEKELERMKINSEKQLTDWLFRLKEVEDKIMKIENENKEMDKKIEKMNVDRWELEWKRDVDGEAKQKEYQDRRMAVVVRRSRLVRILQKEYMEVLAMETEHELQRLRRFPTLNFFKTLDDETKEKNLC